MADGVSDFKNSAQHASDILFPALQWYLEFLAAYLVCVAFVMIWKVSRKGSDKPHD